MQKLKDACCVHLNFKGIYFGLFLQTCNIFRRLPIQIFRAHCQIDHMTTNNENVSIQASILSARLYDSFDGGHFYFICHLFTLYFFCSVQMQNFLSFLIRQRVNNSYREFLLSRKFFRNIVIMI